MAFCKFYRTVAVTIFFWGISVFEVLNWDVRVTVTSIMAETQIKNFPKGGYENDFFQIKAEVIFNSSGNEVARKVATLRTSLF